MMIGRQTLTRALVLTSCAAFAPVAVAEESGPAWPYNPMPNMETIGPSVVDWLQSMGFQKVQPRAVDGYTMTLTGYFPCPEAPPVGWEPLCPEDRVGMVIPHELLVDTLPMSVVITTWGKNHPLGPWLVTGWPAEVRKPYEIADPDLLGKCTPPKP